MPGNIMLVEDETLIAMAEEADLRKYGYTVRRVQNGEAAIKLLNTGKKKFDLVLMDINLGSGMDGTETAMRILETIDIPIVFVSSHTEPEVVQKTEKITSYGYVVKNSGITVLDTAIKMAFRLFEEKQKTIAQQNRIEASEEMFHQLFEQQGGYSLILDPNTQDGIPLILDANKAACEMHGYTKEEFIGNPVAMIDDDDGKKMVRTRTQEIMTGKPFYVENTHIRKDGTTFPVAVYAKRIDLKDRKPLILSTEYDISSQKTAEARQKQLIAEKDLILREAYHRMKNNIFQIESLLKADMGLLKEGQSLQVMQHAVSQVESTRILYDKLLLSDKDVEVSMESYLASLVESLQQIYGGETGISILTTIHDFFIPAKTASILGYVAIELITNSIKHGFSDGRSGIVECFLQKEGDLVTLRIIDNGKGLPADFDHKESSGFGLNLVRGLTAQLNGTFTIDRNNGTDCFLCFNLNVPD